MESKSSQGTMKRLVMDVLFRNKHQDGVDRLMHATDVFERGKQFAQYECLEFEINEIPETGEKGQTLQNLFNLMKKGFEENEGYKIIFMGVRIYGDGRPKEITPVFRKDIQSLSMIQNGKLGWSLFKDVLEHLGWEVETDDKMHLTKVT
jgi:hypothetical protein